jgi:ribose transport system substrate-binding protein
MRTTRFGRSAIALTTLALAAAALAAPVAAQSPSAPAQTGAGKTIKVISPDYAAQPAAKEAIDDFMAVAEARGYTVKLVDTNSDNAAINGELTTAVAEHVDAIVTAFGTPQEFGEGLAAVAAAGVPVFGLDTGGVVDPTLVNVTTNNQFLGEASAKAIIDALGGKGKVAIIHFDPFEPVRLRAEAARAAFKAAGIEIVEDTQGDPADPTGFAKATALDWLTKYPAGELNAIWAGWDASALGAYQATQETGRTDVLVTGVDGQDFAQAEVAKGGNWIATVRQDWPTIATTLTDIIDAHFAGTDPTDKTVYVPAILITKDNAKAGS